MKKRNDKKIIYAISFSILGVLVSTPFVISGAWPVAVLVGGVCSIYPFAVILDKMGLIELVNVSKYQKIVDENDNVLYDNTVEHKKNNINYQKELYSTEEKKKQDIIFKDFPKLHITEETRKDVLKHPNLYTNSDVRTRMGKFYTDEEWDQRREEILNIPLPGENKKGHVLIKKMSPKNK